MPKSKPQTHPHQPLLKNFRSLEEFWKFWDTHSTADYEESMENVDARVDIRSGKIYCPVAKEIIAELRVQAPRQGISTETLINLWLREKVQQTAQSQ